MREIKTTELRIFIDSPSSVWDCDSRLAFIFDQFFSIRKSQSLKCSSNSEFDVMPRFADSERQPRGGSKKGPINLERVVREDQSKRRIDDRHDDLDLDPGAHPEAGVRSWQELRPFQVNGSVGVDHLARQLTLLRH